MHATAPVPPEMRSERRRRSPAGASAGASAERRALLVAAAAALWQYVVQREAMGLTNHDALEHVYGVTRELWSLMGSAEVVCRKCGQ